MRHIGSRILLTEKEVGRNILDYLEERGITQAELARAIGEAKSELNVKLNHNTTNRSRRYLRATTVMKIAYALGVDMNIFFIRRDIRHGREKERGA